MHALFRIFLVYSGSYEVIGRNTCLEKKEIRKTKDLSCREEITVSGLPKFLLTPPQTTRD